MDDKNENNLAYSFIFGMLIGSAIGIVAWLFTDEFLWVGIGPAIGLAFGIFLGTYLSFSHDIKADEETKGKK